MVPAVEFSEGSITSATDPCTGATVAGGLEAVITYLPDPDVPEVEVEIIGRSLQGSDGTSYTLEVYGAAEGSPGQQTFEVATDWMVLSREDGVDFFDSAVITIEIVDGRPGSWSYTSAGADCPG